MITIVLLIMLAIVGLFGMMQIGQAPAIGRTVLGMAVTGSIFVLQPDLTTRIALTLGVGRGTDLILYIWLVLSLLVVTVMMLRARRQDEKITLLAREITYLRNRQADSESALPK